MEVNPISVILVFMDSKGDRLLYRYPYQQAACAADEQTTDKKRNPYALIENNNHTDSQTAQQTTNFSDEVLSTLFAVKSQLCNQKFEVKINDVRFVSHPTLIQRKEGVGSAETPNIAVPLSTATGTAVAGAAPQQMLINIVFSLHAQASYSIVKCYHGLSKRLGLALKVEEQRIGYVSDETLKMARTHDEVSTQQQTVERAFELVTERSSLAQALKSIYYDLCTSGLLNTTLNQNLTVTFCLPQKAHQLHKKGSLVDPETIDRCLRALKPYHSILLLADCAELLDCVPPAGACMLRQLIDVYSPLHSLQKMASDADLSLEHVYKLVWHLVYWAKATIIYPLCQTNVYVIAPDAPLHTKSHLVEKFSTRFAGMSLFEVIADFSLPTSIRHLTTPLQQPARERILAQMVLWMLQHHLLTQLHTYVQFMPSDLDELQSELGGAEVTGGGDSSSLDVDLREDDEENDIEVDVEVEDEDGSVGLGMAGVADCEDAGVSDIDDDDDDEELNAGSLLSMSSQPLAVPRTSRRSITEDRYSACGSTASDNIAAQPSSSHKSNFSMTASLCSDNTGSIASIEDEQKIKELLQVFEESDRAAIRRIPASTNVDDLELMVKLYQAGYFKSEHHLEEIMYFENLRQSQLLQLLDKFRDVLIIYETEDPAIATMYHSSNK